MDNRNGRSGEDRIRRLGHMNETGIGETYRQVSVFLHEREGFLHAVVEMEGGDDCAAADERGESRGATRAEKVKGLRQSRVARLPGRREPRRLGTAQR